MSQASWLVAGLVPGLSRDPGKTVEPDPEGLLAVLRPWQREAERAGRPIGRIAVSYEAGRGGFWLARWLRPRGIGPHGIHFTTIPGPRRHRRPQSARLHPGPLTSGFLAWLSGWR